MDIFIQTSPSRIFLHVSTVSRKYKGFWTQFRHVALPCKYRLPEVGLNRRDMVERAHSGHAALLEARCLTARAWDEVEDTRNHSRRLGIC